MNLGALGTIDGYKIITSAYATTSVRLHTARQDRRKNYRVQAKRKLRDDRHGERWDREPFHGFYRIGKDTLVMHPAFYAKLVKQLGKEGCVL